MNVREGGEMAGTAKFAFRQKEDPRYTDRRMQNLLRKIDDSFSKYNAHQVSLLLYSTLRLRFPYDNLLKLCLNFITDHLREEDSFTPKDTALTLWALARMSYPSLHMQNLLLRKVTKQVQALKKDEKRFNEASKEDKESSSSYEEEEEEEGEIKPEISEG